MSAFMDAGHHWWMQCPSCGMAWFVGEQPDEGEDAEEECSRCKAGDDTAAIRKAARTLDRERTGLYVMGGEVDEAWALFSRIASEAP